MTSPQPQCIVSHRFASPLGEMCVCATDHAVCLLEFTDQDALETELRDLRRLLHAEIACGENRHTRQAEAQIAEYFAGQRTVFELALQMPGTDFQRAVWQALLTVPYGETVSYQTQADRIGRPTATRAVAAANGANRISIVVPCHRVIGKDGSLTGYGGGIRRKRWLLEHERRLGGQGGQLPLLLGA